MLSLKRSLDLIHAAIEAADEVGLPISAVVVDRGGRTIAAARSERAAYLSLDAAEKKAVTAISFGVSTLRLMEMVKGDPMLLSAVSGETTLSILPGGVPVMVDGVVVAALGIAGGHYSQDQAIAEKAMAVSR